MQPKHVLVIDDDTGMLDLVDLIFTRAGSRVSLASDGLDGLRQLYETQPDLVILDLMMPGIDGWEICRRIRELSQVPVIILTAVDQDAELVRSLACGADDFVVKPFNPEILLARARAVLRRASHLLKPSSNYYNDSYLTIDLDRRRVFRQGEAVNLTSIERRLLTYLVQNANRILTFQQILIQVWGDEHQDKTEYVHVYIRHLRSKLEENPSEPVYIITEYGVGYRFETQHQRFDS